jgi:hypothetical protein
MVWFPGYIKSADSTSVERSASFFNLLIHQINNMSSSHWIASSVQGTNRVVSIVSSSHCHRVATCVRCERGIVLFFYNSEDSDVGGVFPSGEGLLYYDTEKTPMLVYFVYY